MKKVKKVSTQMLLAVLIFSASIASAQMENGPKNVNNNQQQAFRGIENSIPDLTDKQKTEIKTLRVAHMKEVQQLKNKMDIKRAELKALQTQEKPDLNAINKKSKKRQL